jgi:hypothetical protein
MTMTPKELQDTDLDFEDFDADAELDREIDGDWDEETLGLDWNDADTLSVVEEVTRLR